MSKVDVGVSIETWEVTVDTTPENLLRVGAQTRTLARPSVTILPCVGMLPPDMLTRRLVSWSMLSGGGRQGDGNDNSQDGI